MQERAAPAPQINMDQNSAHQIHYRSLAEQVRHAARNTALRLIARVTHDRVRT